MPFNNMNGGKGGWDQPPPSVDEILEKAGNFFKGGSLMVLVLAALVFLAFVIFNFSYYTVGPNEVGMVQRFGKYVKQTEPGPHLKWPIMEEVTTVKVDYIYSEEFGLRTLSPGVRTEYASSRAFKDESLMLTGDLNSAMVPWIVQYRVSDPFDFLFRVRNVRETLRDLSEAIMRQVVGDRSVNEVINHREEIADIAEVELQKALDEAQTGIMVRNVELKKTMPPEPVQPSWNEVNQAVQEKEQMIWKAKEEYNRAIPAAKGQADKVISEAEFRGLLSTYLNKKLKKNANN